MQPRNPDNFLVEITPEVYNELQRNTVADNPIAEMYYSPYWNWEAYQARHKAKSQPNHAAPDGRTGVEGESNV